MIKKYSQFVSKRVNEEFEQEFDEFDTNQQDSDIESDNIEVENRFGEEEQMEEEGGDIYQSRLKEVADKLGVEVEDGKVMYNGKKIIFPSETEMYHVDGKKFKTSDEVVKHLEQGTTKSNSDRLPKFNNKQVPKEEMELELQESKSYKNTRRFKNKRK
jgi:hypothetical protein